MATIADKLTYLNGTKTAIKNALVSKGVVIKDTDTFRSYADKIENISGEPATRFGASADAWIGEVDENGVLQKPTTPTVLNFEGVTEIGESVLRYAFYGCTGITSVDLSSLESVRLMGLNAAFEYCTGLTSVDLSSLQSIGNGGLAIAFDGCTGLTSVDLSSLESVEAAGLQRTFCDCTGLTNIDLHSLTTVEDSGLYYTFCDCTGITSVDLSSLQSVGPVGLKGVFDGCTGLTTISFPSLTSVQAGSLDYAFYGCTGLTTISFPSLTDVQIDSFGSATSNSAFRNCPALTEIHFRADMQTTIAAMSQYENKWGATNATISFDLP